MGGQLPRWVLDTVASLDDSQPEVRKDAAGRLRMYGEQAETILSALKRAAESDQDQGVREAAKKALSALEAATADEHASWKVVFTIVGLLLAPLFFFGAVFLVAYSLSRSSEGLYAFNLVAFMPIVLTFLCPLGFWLILYKGWHATWGRIALIVLATISIASGCVSVDAWTHGLY